MTREETKKHFKSWCQGHIGNNASFEDYHMFNNIMALLEQDEIIADCISREQAIEEADKLCLETCYDNEKVTDMLNELPSATPIRPKGHWREVDINQYACSKCSRCLTIDPLDNSISEMNTCPFCSADMREVKE